MSPKLKPLLLPQLVEERRKRESLSDSTDLDFTSSFLTQNSSASDISAPLTPTFSHSLRGHVRYSSSTSSLDLPMMHPSVAESGPSSPTFVGGTSKSSKRSLPDLQEEPQEQEGDFDMFDDYAYDCCGLDHSCLQDNTLAQSAFELPTKQDLEYDMTYCFYGDWEDSLPRSKKRREAETSFTNGIATRLGTRFPSFSRRWRQRKTSNPGLNSPSQRDSSRSRANSRAASSRSSSLTGSFRYGDPEIMLSRMPPTPTASVFGGSDDGTVCPIDVEKANKTTEDDPEECMATTPLLPPLMMDANANTTPVYQSPLQSPSVADVNDPISGNNSPIERVITAGMPSPPLSTKPSISSFHRVNSGRPGHLIPSSEIPPIHIADINDEWANKLGHANFTVQPEPYLPTTFDLDACRQVRADWDLARCNYTKHLVRTGEHYGATSKTYKLTEEKWTQVDAQWRKYNDETIVRLVEKGGDALRTLKHANIGDPSNAMTKIPSLNDPRSGGKFPQLGDEDIVGPMVQELRLQQSPSKKAKLFKFFTEKFPTGIGRAIAA